uniref:PUA domain containing protein n=2 Tax=Methanococcus voltae TaxID=2188 RepID=D7DUK8_METV3
MYDIGRICKETIEVEDGKKTESEIKMGITPKIIDEDYLTSLKSNNTDNTDNKDNILKIPFDCPESLKNTILNLNINNNINNNDKIEIINFGKDISKNLDDIDPNKELYIIVDILQMISRKELINIIPKIREKISPNAGIYVPNVLPAQVPLLVYMGVDYFDYGAVDYYSAMGYQLSKNRQYKISNVKNELSNNNNNNNNNNKENNKESALKFHNRQIMDAVIEETLYCIENQKLRNLVEETTISDPYLRANYRRYVPDLRNIPLSTENKLIVTMDEVKIPEVKKYIERAVNYTPFSNLIVLLPCSSKKPYSLSKSHQKFIGAINSIKTPVDELILTSPYGIVPRALELSVKYDIPVTGEWSADEVEFINENLAKYLKNAKNKFSNDEATKKGLKVIAHLPDHYLEILDMERMNSILTDEDEFIISSINGNPTTNDSISNLKAILKDLEIKMREEQKLNAISKRENSEKSEETNNNANENNNNNNNNNVDNTEKPLRFTRRGQVIHNYQELAKFQFGKNFIPNDVVVKGKHKKFFIKQNGKEVQICTLNDRKGLFVLTVNGGELLGKENWVELNFKAKKGSLFAPGFKDAQDIISVNDEVVIYYEDKYLGVGRALMNASEMKKATSGILLSIRHVFK